MEISPFFCEKNGDFSIILRKEWRFLHSFCFRPHSAMLFWIFTNKKKRMEKSPFSKKRSVFTLKNMLKNAYFFQFRASKRFSKKKNGDFSILLRKDWRFLHSFAEISPFFFSTPFSNVILDFHYQKKENGEISPFSKTKRRFHLQHAEKHFWFNFERQNVFSQKKGDFSILICGPHSADYP